MKGKPQGRPNYGIDSPAMVIGAWVLFALGEPHLFGIPLSPTPRLKPGACPHRAAGLQGQVT
jgi:hypothetical protein